jgi:hypothetical protein
MIVEPDFPDHWKVQLLVTRLQSEAGVRCLLRLWAYCQARRDDCFPFTPDVLAAVCRWEGKPSVFWEAMTHDVGGWLELEIGTEATGTKAQSGQGGQAPTCPGGSVAPESAVVVPRGTLWRVRQFADVNATLFQKWRARRSKTGRQGNGNDSAGDRRVIGDPTGKGSAGDRPANGEGAIEGKGREGIEKKGGDGIDAREPGALSGDSEPLSPSSSPSSGSARPGGSQSAPVTLEEAVAWAEKFSRGNAWGLEISAGEVREWYDSRAKVGWETPLGQNLVPIGDWQADLRDFKQWKLRGGGGRPFEKKWGAESGLGLPKVGPVANLEAPPGWKAAAVEVLGFEPESWEAVPAASKGDVREWLAKASNVS